MREHEKRIACRTASGRRRARHATEGNVIDYDRIFRTSRARSSTRFPRLRGAEIGYDPAFATDIAMKLQGAGFRMVEVLQNYKHLSEPAHVLEALVRASASPTTGTACSAGTWRTARSRQDDAGRIRPVKPKRATRRIDGVVATVMGVSRLMWSQSRVGRDGGVPSQEWGRRMAPPFDLTPCESSCQDVDDR
jgi:phage terminase large subunit-like protein